MTAQPLTQVFIGLGSNLGHRLLNLTHAFAMVSQVPHIENACLSTVFESKAQQWPTDTSQAPDFLNAVAVFWCGLSARALLQHLLQIEKRMGRVRQERWGPRIIDLDILYFGTLRIEEPGLTIPHPRIHERPFVMLPLRELKARLVLRSLS
jgi:2-amino-4-hydroxy-6-hydroxymethyldihydropteridine diphosphokinase